LMSRITNDSLFLGELFHHGPEDLAIGALKFFGPLAVLAVIDPLLTALIAGLTPFALAYALHFNRRMNRAQARSRRRSPASTNASRMRSPAPGLSRSP
ncbi:hypothetical protein J8J40_26085, partial [Mycobacterium tuberculosis]|nr:hypothetical protein [Mycobacterium tuberculosis]